jgi:hypothetical protein
VYGVVCVVMAVCVCVRARVDDLDSFLAIFMAFALYMHVCARAC